MTVKAFLGFLALSCLMPRAQTVASLSDSVTNAYSDSLPLGIHDFETAPNPFSPLDSWGLQFSYRLSSGVSRWVSIRVEVLNALGDKVYSSDEVQIDKTQPVKPGTYKADPASPERLRSLAPYVWDGRDTRGVLCRNGPYLLRLTVRDGRGTRQIWRKVVLLK